MKKIYTLLAALATATAMNAGGLFFSQDLIGKGVVAQNITLTDESTGAQVVFTSNSANAEVDASNGNFGTATDYTTIAYRYRPGGKSTKGIESENKGVFTFPCDGTLTIYAFNTSTDEERSLQLLDSTGEPIWEHTFLDTDYVSPEGKTTKIYPIFEASVKAGTAYLVWPVNQLMLYGFEFVSESNTGAVNEIKTVELIDGPAFDLTGRQVDDNYKGIVIQNGKKFIRR